MKWPLVKVASIRADCRHSLVGGPFGSELTTRDYVAEGVPVIRGVNLPADCRFFDDDFVYVSEQKADQLVANNARVGDVVFTQRGTLGQVGLIPPEPRFARYLVSQSQMKLTVNPKIADAAFVFYYFRHPETVQKIKNRAITSGVPHINLGILRDFDIPLPPLPAQRQIVALLSNYDDLIENNRRRMALLEEAARHLYEEWFVRLRFPGREHSRIRNDVPEGWVQRSLGECATFLSGGTPTKTRPEYWEGDIPWVSSGELTVTRIHDVSLHITAEAVEAGSRLVPPDTILAVVRGMSLAKDFRVSITARPVAFNQDLKALVSSRGVDAAYLYSALNAQRQQIRDRATEASHGTKKLDTPVLASVPILVPPPAIQHGFRNFVAPMNSQWDNLYQQNRRLQTARDLLLPRLLSGEMLV